MGIGRKVLLLNLLLAFLAVALVFAVGHHIWTSGYRQLEAEAVRDATKRATEIWNAEIELMALLVNDWAPWDELYFAAQENRLEPFVRKNLSAERMQNLRLDLLLILDDNGRIVLLREQGEHGYERIELQQHAARIAAVLPREIKRNSLLKGLVLLQDGPVLLAAQRISTTEFAGESPGILLFGRRVEEQYMREMVRRAQLEMVIQRCSEEAMSEYKQEIIDEDWVSGRQRIADVYGERNQWIAVTLPRHIVRQGLSTMREYALLTLLFGGAISLLTFWLLQKLVLRRLARLDEFMRSVTSGEKTPQLLVDGDDEVAHTVQAMNDMLDQLQATQAELVERSVHDVLTGLYNRTFFQQEMDRLAERKLQSIGVIVGDLDGLKIINDTLGHEAGDEMLKQAALILKSVLNEDALVIRMGGDEFVMLAYNVPQEFIRQACTKIAEAAQACKLKQEGFSLRLSLGWEWSAGPAFDREHIATLIKAADDAMYRRKLATNSENRRSLLTEILKMLDIRDSINEGHGERVAELARRLGELAGLDDERLERLSLLGRVHDIGKVGVADAVVFKEGELTEPERLEMERHPEIGYRIAQAIPELAAIGDLILKHHEWWNGSGYPLRLRGLEIPHEARVLAIVDAYDEMTQDRPYRRAMMRSAALGELEKMAGRQFDPELVTLFVRQMK